MRSAESEAVLAYKQTPEFCTQFFDQYEKLSVATQPMHFWLTTRMGLSRGSARL